eukprot:2042616-Amphidinium_carterae.1
MAIDRFDDAVVLRFSRGEAHRRLQVALGFKAVRAKEGCCTCRALPVYPVTCVVCVHGDSDLAWPALFAVHVHQAPVAVK